MVASPVRPQHAAMGVRSLVVATATALLLAGCGSGGAEPVSSARVPAGLEAGCPDPTTEPRLPGGDLPRGAIRVRLCPGPSFLDNHGSPVAPDIQGPADLLTADVDELVTLVNEQDDLDGELLCSSDAGPELVYWFGYPGGDWRAVQHGSYGCDVVRVGTRSRRLGGVELSLAFTEALLAQRPSAEPPVGVPAARCLAPYETPRSALASADLDLASATLCVSPRPDTVRSAPLPPELLERVDAALWPGVAERSRWPCTTGGSEWIEGVTPWGDRVAWGIDACGLLYPLHGASVLPYERQYLSPELDAAFAALPLGPSEQLG